MRAGIPFAFVFWANLGVDLLACHLFDGMQGKAAWTGGRAAAGGEALFASDKYVDFTLSFAPFLRLVSAACVPLACRPHKRWLWTVDCWLSDGN